MSGGGGNTQTIQKADPWSGAQPALRQFYTGMQNYLSQTPQQYYPGQTVAGLTPEQLQAQQMALGAADSLSGQIPQLQSQYGSFLGNNAGMNNILTPLSQTGDVYSSLLNGNGTVNAAQTGLAGYTGGTPVSINPLAGAALSGYTGGTPVLTNPTANAALSNLATSPINPYTDAAANAITQQMTQNFQNSVLPSIRDSALSAGTYGGSRMGLAEGLAAGQFSNALGGQLSNLYSNAYESGQNRALSAAGTLGNLTSAQNAALANSAGVGINAANALGNLTNAENAARVNSAGVGINAANALGGLGLGSGNQQLSAANSIYGNYNTNAGQELQAMGLAPSMYGLSTLPSSLYQTVGAQNQNQNQQDINAAMQQYYYNPQLQQLSQAAPLLGVGANLGANTSTQTQNPSTLQNAMGLGSTALDAYLLYTML